MSSPSENAVLDLSNASRETHPPAGALVMGGDYRGLGLVRSLGRHGIPVWVIYQDDQRLASCSKYSQRGLYFPSWQDENGVEFLIELARKHGLKNWLLLPTSDDSVRLVSSHHAELAQYFQLTVPPWETLKWAVDKGLMHRMADKIGVDHPQAFYPQNRDDFASMNLQFPVVLKPTTREKPNRLTSAKAWRADDLKTLLALYGEACQLLPSEMLMIQELIPGGGETQFSYAALCEDGRPLASLVARRSRQFPMDFGRASTYVETVDDPGIAVPAVRFLEALRFTGIVEVEFKQDPRTGQFKLLDINPRVWGWYSLCGRAGVDFGYLLWLLYQGQTVPEGHAQAGVRWVRMTTDFLTCVSEIKASRISIPEYLRSLRGPKESAIFASDDPWPGLLELPLLCFMFCKRVLRGKVI